MKKVLILAYDFPPYVSVGGLRPYSWYKYLHEFGVYPIVITRQWGNNYGSHLDYIAPSEFIDTIVEKTIEGKLIKTAYKPNLANKILLKYGESKYKIIRKIVSAYYEYAQFLFKVGPKANLYYEATKYLKNNKVDVIIATGDPFILFDYASELSKKYNIPWIADYRDQWSQNAYSKKMTLVKKWHSHLEYKISNTASAITTVSEFLKIKISETINNKNIFVLPNGYEPSAIESVKGIDQKSDILRIAYVGSIYDWHPLRSFLSQLSKLIYERKDIKICVNFYGINLYGVTYKNGLEEIIKTEFPTLIDSVTVHKKIPNPILLIELSKHNVMLLFNYYSYMGTKIFDYIGLKRLILFCYTNDTQSNELKKKYYDIKEIEGISSQLQADLITKTNSGYLIKDANHLYTKLHDICDEFKKNGLIKCNTTNGDYYSRKIQTKKLSNIINNLC